MPDSNPLQNHINKNVGYKYNDIRFNAYYNMNLSSEKIVFVIKSVILAIILEE